MDDMILDDIDVAGAFSSTVTMSNIEYSISLVKGILPTVRERLAETLSGSTYQYLLTTIQDYRNELQLRLRENLQRSDKDAVRDGTALIAEADAAILKLIERIENLRVSETKTIAQTHYPQYLPKVKLPKFSGELSEWKTFWGLFEEIIHQRQDLGEVLKFNYLIDSLVAEPKELLKGLQITAINYNLAIKILKDRYDNEEKFLQSLLHKFHSLNSPKHNLVELKHFKIQYNQILSQITSLSSLTGADLLIKSVLLQKLSRQTYEQIVGHLKKFDFSLAELSQGLEFVIDLFEYQQIIAGETTQVKTIQGKCKREGNTFISSKTSDLKSKCKFCQGDHRSHECTKYKTYNSRRDRAQALRLCFNCLNSGHAVRDCKSKGRCRHCSNMHHSSLCYKFAFKSPTSSSANSAPKKQPVSISPTLSTPTISNSSSLRSSTNPVSSALPDNTSPSATAMTNVTTVNTAMTLNDLPPSALPTATVVVNNHNKIVETRAFFDTGSQRSFISSKLAAHLNLPVIAQVPMLLSTFGAETVSETYDLVKAKLQLGKRKIVVRLVVHDQVSTVVDCPGISRVAEVFANQGVTLADKYIHSDCLKGIELLIGVDYFGKFINGQRRYLGIDTFLSPAGVLPFGILPKWTLPLASAPMPQPVLCARVLCQPETDVDQLWKLESIGICKEVLSPSEIKTVSQTTSSIIKGDQNYQVRLPFKGEERPSINYRTARGQLNSLRAKIKTDVDFFNQYDSVIRDHLSKGFIEEIVDDKIDGHYLPHHPVYKNSSTTPLRIVFNASSKGLGGKSLNDCLHTGPSLTAKLFDTLLRFRENPIAVVSDISRAFHRIQIHEDDRRFVKFLWTNGECNRLLTYVFKVVIFGATCSPYLLQQVLATHFESRSDPYDLSRSFYVDNLLKTYVNETTLIEEKPSIDKILLDANMPLQGWTSNGKKFRQVYQVEEPIDQNVLGLTWNVDRDTLRVEEGRKLPVDIESWVPTKRTFLSSVVSVFDPLGLINPLVVASRIFLQVLWKEGYGWDQPLSVELSQQAKQLIQGMKGVECVEFPRFSTRKGDELHVFVDASSKAYGAAAYSVNLACNQSNLLVSKLRITPCRSEKLTIPKLELTALLIGVRLASHLQSLFVFSQTIVWSDSKIVLAWVKSDKEVKDVYASNRIAEIQSLIKVCSLTLMHVHSSDNPADILSRGSSLTNLSSNSLWKHGPPWLLTQQYPKQGDVVVVVREIVTEILPIEPIQPVVDLERFSSLIRLREAVRLVLKFMRSTRDPLLVIVQQEQRYHCNSLYTFLLNKNTPVNTDIKNTVRQLNLYLDNGVIRSKGRLINSTLNHNGKTPVFIPTRSQLVTLFALHIHEHNMHCGLTQTLAHYRQFAWTPRLRPRLKVVLQNCYRCKRVKQRALAQPPPPQLPVERVTYQCPFQAVGIDHTGYFNLRMPDGETTKGYICIFVCTATRAVHLELNLTLSTYDFLLGFRRFAARYGTPSVILSDNAKTFKSAETFLLEIQQDPQVQEFLRGQGISWRFQTPRAPWMGGHFERLIGVVKSCLATSLQRKLVSPEEFRTLLKECETIVNNRPLTYQGATDDDEPLTPSMLVQGKNVILAPPLLELPPIDYAEPDGRLLRVQYQKLSAALERFQKRWRDEYLTSLRERHRNICANQNIHPLREGDLVMLQTKECHRLDWPLVRITRVFPDANGVIRTVEVLKEGERYVRPVSQVVPLELSCETPVSENGSTQSIPSEAGPEVLAESSVSNPSEEWFESSLVNVEPGDASSSSQSVIDPVVDNRAEGIAIALQPEPARFPIQEESLVSEIQERPRRVAAQRQREHLRALIDSDLV